MSKFKNIEALGLVTYAHPWGMERRSEEFVRAVDLESLLSQGVRVYNAHSAQGRPYERTWFTNETHTATQSALLIGMRPIERDTAEGLLREALADCRTFGGLVGEAWLERAMRLVGK